MKFAKYFNWREACWKFLSEFSEAAIFACEAISCKIHEPSFWHIGTMTENSEPYQGILGCEAILRSLSQYQTVHYSGMFKKAALYPDEKILSHIWLWSHFDNDGPYLIFEPNFELYWYKNCDRYQFLIKLTITIFWYNNFLFLKKLS